MYKNTSKTLQERRATAGSLWERSVERSSEGGFWMEYLHVSADSSSIANRFSSSSYVDPPSFRLRLTPDIHHPESVRPAGPAGRTHISRIHSNGQPSVATILVAY